MANNILCPMMFFPSIVKQIDSIQIREKESMMTLFMNCIIHFCRRHFAKEVDRLYQYSFMSVYFHLESIMTDSTSTSNTSQKPATRDEGKFVDLPNAKEGNVVVRFPPEASGSVDFCAKRSFFYPKTCSQN